jgi:hypothetical protein
MPCNHINQIAGISLDVDGIFTKTLRCLKPGCGEFTKTSWKRGAVIDLSKEKVCKTSDIKVESEDPPDPNIPECLR